MLACGVALGSAALSGWGGRPGKVEVLCKADFVYSS